MKLVRVNETGLKQLYDTELRVTFPPMELKPLWAMEELRRDGQYHTFAALDDEGERFGYAFLWSHEPQGHILLDYLGVTQDRRNGGLGGAVLELLKEQFADWEGIVVESEAVDGSPESELRKRRFAFYERHGFAFQGYDAWLFGVHYRTMACALKKERCESRAMEAHRNIYGHYFTPEQIEKFVRVPWQVGQPLPAFDWEGLARGF